MKEIMTFVLVAALLLPAAISCTTKENKVADQAFTLGLKQYGTITDDFRNKARQHMANYYAAKAREAARSSNEDAAAAAVIDALNEYREISFLDREARNAREILGIPRRYVWKQRGWASILKDDWVEAWNDVNNDGDVNSNGK